MKLSIVLTTYNFSPYFDQIVNLIKELPSNFDLIIVDDSSIDGSWTRLMNFKHNTDYVFETYPKTVQTGVSNSRNIGIKLAKTELICFLDQDDSLDLGSLQKALISIPMAIDDNDLFVFPYQTSFTQSGQILYDKLSISPSSISSTKYLAKSNHFADKHSYRLLNLTALAAWSKVFKKSVIEANAIYFPEGVEKYEDCYFSLHYLLVSKNIYYQNAVFILIIICGISPQVYQMHMIGTHG